ncbi:hypothetical protein HDZ31DRAFT_43021 [Schizophyllum fasciatum]
MKGAAPASPARFRHRPHYAQLAVLTLLFAVSTTLFWAYRIPPRQKVQIVAPVETDPARDWHDNVWPLREQTPWDISTDFPYPRRFQADVTEGTWLRLDVHPNSGDIVFDILGDIYCISGDDWGVPARARPVLLGVPKEADARFSPDGMRLAFRSDAGLGLDNIWVIPWHGCSNMDVRPSTNTPSKLASALAARDADEALLVAGVPETAERRERRLQREGRLDAVRITNETYRFVTDPRWHPYDERIIATKWYTGSITIPGGEGWTYDAPTTRTLKTVSSGAGNRTVIRELPRGWKAEDYPDVNLGPEQLIWYGKDAVIYSKNVQLNGRYEYGQNIHKGIYAIFSCNLTSGAVQTLVDALPGGASRPELSRDQRTLAFVRRVRDKQVLYLLDIASGTLHNVWDGLSHDLQLVGGIAGTYPSFAFTPNDDAIIIWAHGLIWRVPLSLSPAGQRVAGNTPSPIPFIAHLELQLADTRKEALDLVALETRPSHPVRTFRELDVDYAGSRVVFEAAGVTYMHDTARNLTTELPRLHSNAAYFSPAFVPDTELIIHTRWVDDVETRSDTAIFSTFELVHVASGRVWEVAGLPAGRHFSPSVSGGKGSLRKLAFMRAAGDVITGNVVETANPGLYVADIELPDIAFVSPGARTGSRFARATNVRRIGSDVAATTMGFLRLEFASANQVLVHTPRRTVSVNLDSDPEASGLPAHTTLAQGRMSSELRVRPTRGPHGAAFVDHYHVYYIPQVMAHTDLWAKPANATPGLVRLTINGGHDLAWSGSGETLFWASGPTIHSVEVDKLAECREESQADMLTFGINCVALLVKRHPVSIEHASDISRLREEARGVAEAAGDHNANSDVLIIANATILTMASGSGPSEDIVYHASLVTRGGIIEAVGPTAAVVVPEGATVLDAQGGFVTPGFVDAHAHWGDYMVRFPATSWEMQVFLAYGVTTLHNPSALTVEAFAQRSRLERGQLIGPRIFSTGMVLFGGGWPGIHHEVVDMQQARESLWRIRNEAGPYMLAYKNYQLPSRASRQRLLLASREVGLMCVPEGGANWDWDLTYIIDGMTTMEHSLPISPLYEDVLALFSASGTGYTPTHIVSYGGIMGEEIVWSTKDIPNDEKLRHFIPHTQLYELSESTSRPAYSFELWNMSSDARKLARRGIPVHIGAHGEQPMGLNYHSEMWFSRQGGLSNYEVFRAATLDAAKTFGLDAAIGSLVPGKLADFLIYPPGVDILADDIQRSRELSYVARGGRIWNATVMEEVWPVKGKRQAMPPYNVD